MQAAGLQNFPDYRPLGPVQQKFEATGWTQDQQTVELTDRTPQTVQAW